MKLIIAILSILLFPIQSFGQKIEKPLVGTFVSVCATHGQGSISSIHFSVSGVSGEIEKYFTENHFWFSGWEAGYRKLDLGQPDFGHLLGAKIFRLTKIGKLTLKSTVGFELGLSSGDFDKTKWRKDGSYTHLSLQRNLNIPFLQEGISGVIYPTIEIGILSHKGPFLFQTGIMFNILNLGVDVWRCVPNDCRNGWSNKRLLIPQVFFGVGIPMGPL